jgi:hypothetical protein
VTVRRIEDLTHDELAVLGREYLLAGQLMDRAGMPHLISAYGREVMGEIAIDEWMGASPVYTRRMQRLLGFANGDVETIFKGMQFDIGAPPEFMDFRYKVIDATHGEFWLDHCGALMDVEPMGDEYVTTMCHAIEDPTFDATATATSYFARMRPIHRPPRTPAERHPHCHWTVEINEEFGALPDPEPAAHIGATSLASFELDPIGTGATEAELVDGWSDYTAPIDPDLQLEQFSTAVLRTLADEVCVQQHLLVMSFLLAIERRYSTEDAVAIGAKQFAGIAGLTAERLRAAFDLPSDLDGIAQVIELHPAFRPRGYVDFRVELEQGAAGADRLVLRLGRGVALDESGRDSWITILADGHDAALQAAVQAIDPGARIESVVAGPDDVAAWQVTLGHEPAKESSEVALTRFSTGADFQFVATPVTLAARTGG